MVTVEVLRVFTDEHGRYGNQLGVVLDGAAVPETQRRQQLATRLGFSETIFVDDVDSGRIRIFTPAIELAFAGHPVVGAAWLVARETGRVPTGVETVAGTATTWTQHGRVWVRGDLAGTPPWWHERLPTSAAVARLTGPLNPNQDATQLWAWHDEPAGVIRARVFAARYGVAEDEATGSASMRLAAALGRAITIHHGNGSIIHAQPGPPGTAEIGGHVISDGTVVSASE